MKFTSSLRLAAAISLTLSTPFATNALASPLFANDIPTGWSCVGSCGSGVADGVVALAPQSSTPYGWVSTYGGEYYVGLGGLEGVTGSVLRSSAFDAAEGERLSFDFNYITADGSGFADYAWSRLLNANYQQIAILFTARTTSDGFVVPGFDMPLPEAELNPDAVQIINGAPRWSYLGDSSNSCFGNGCGHTGWVEANYDIAAAGSYILEFGVVNWGDSAFHSGLAFDGISIGGKPIEGVPAPLSIALLAASLLGLGAARKRKA